MIPAYNYGHYLRETLQSILKDDPGPEIMQIMIVDDCSTADDPEIIAREVGGDRIEFFRQSRNLGLIGNIGDCIAHARGEWVHLLHEDDYVLPGFYARAAEAIRTNPTIGAWICRLIVIDQRGNWMCLSELDAEAPGIAAENFIIKEFVTPRIQFAGIMVKRSVYEEIGGFRPELKLCFDWDMWRRVLLHAPAYYDPQPLACFRVHRASAFARATRSGESVRDERRAIQLGDSYLPAELAARIHAEAMTSAAIRAIRLARHHAQAGDWPAARVQITEGLRCSRAPEVLARCLAFAARSTLQLLHPESSLILSDRPGA
jgi:glycosyltransferase involved in cell wall biosynthesis